MPIENSLSFKGLVTSPNNLGAGSEGALVVADNVTIRYPDVLEPRRGQETQTVENRINCTVTAPSGGFRTVTVAAGALTVLAGDSVYLYQTSGGGYDTYEVYNVISATQFRIQTSVITAYNKVIREDQAWSFPVSQVVFFDGETLVHSEDAALIKFVGAQTLTERYDAAKPSGFNSYRLKTAVNGRHLHAATNNGVVVIESADTVTPRVSGIQAPTLPSATVVADTGSPVPPGWFENGKSVAYRAVFGFKDDNDVVHLGPPSERIIVTNTSGTTANVRLSVPLITAPVLVGEDNELVSGLFVQFYRSPVVTSPTQPLDLLQLATEVNVPSDLVYLDALETTDIAPPEFVAAQLPLYTNEEQEGTTQANEPAPYATDLASWSQRLWYANTRQPDSLAVQLLGVGGGGNVNLDATGLRIGDTVTIRSGGSSIVYTAAASTDVSLNQFAVSTTGTPAQNIENALVALAQCVNYALVEDIVAYIVSGPFDVRSNILFRRRTVNEAASVGFTVTYEAKDLSISSMTTAAGITTVNTGTTPHQLLAGDAVRFTRTNYPPLNVRVTNVVDADTFQIAGLSGPYTVYTRVQRRFANTVWNPDLSVGQTSENQLSPERLYYSKVLEPEAVPALNYIDVGTAGKAVLRIQPQRDRLLVFKEEGTFAIYGDYPFSAQLVDDTVQIIAPDSVTAIGSTVFALMDDGVIAVTEGSIQAIDEPIDSLLKPYFASSKLSTTATAFGVGYESEKIFALFMPDIGVTGYGAKAYVYGLASGAWTTWSFPAERKCGRVSPSLDAGFYGLAASPYLVKDRKTSTTSDYENENGTNITSTVQWAPLTLGAPCATKQLREVHAHFRDVKAYPPLYPVGMTWSLKTDIVTAGESIPLWTSTDGFSADSTVIGPARLPLQFRKLVPQPVQRATYYTLGLSATVNRSYWALNGYSLVYEGTSERTGTVR